MLSEKTNNLSFKKMQYALQDISCNNFYFMNELNDPDLEGIDIYKELDRLKNNSEKRNMFINKVLKECKDNIWYYFREIVRIPDYIHTKENIDTNLSMFPLTYKACKMIYLYDMGYSFVTISPNVFLDDIAKYTMAFLMLYDEYFTKDEMYVTLYEGFKRIYQSSLWAINDIAGSIDGISPEIDDTAKWNHIGFNTNDICNKYNCKKDIVIRDHVKDLFAPCITKDDGIVSFFNKAILKNYNNCYGRIAEYPIDNSEKNINETAMYILKNCVLNIIFEDDNINTILSMVDFGIPDNSKIFLV